MVMVSTINMNTKSIKSARVLPADDDDDDVWTVRGPLSVVTIDRPCATRRDR